MSLLVYSNFYEYEEICLYLGGRKCHALRIYDAILVGANRKFNNS